MELRVVEYVETYAEVEAYSTLCSRTYARANQPYEFNFVLTIHEGEIKYKTILILKDGPKRKV